MMPVTIVTPTSTEISNPVRSEAGNAGWRQKPMWDSLWRVDAS
jgi:hypothetical protein